MAPLGAGRPLPPGIRAFFEPRFGRDLSDVRVHTGAEADDSTRTLNAKAYTAGAHVVLGEDAPPLASSAGHFLLAHELTHVAQQRGPGASARRIQRSPRTLPARTGARNFLIVGGGRQGTARTAHFVAAVRPSGDVAAIVGEGMTLRGLAQMLLPSYVEAARAPGGLPAPTEEELAKAILDYDRTSLSPPALADFRAGLRLPLPVEIDPDPGPVSNLREDWLLDPDGVRARAAAVTPAEAALIDHAAAAASPTPGAASVAAFRSSVAGAAAQGLRLHGLVMANPFLNAQLATLVLSGMPPTDRFEVAMGFMDDTTNPHVTQLETLAPGFTLLQALRAALSAPPVGLSAARNEQRLFRAGMLPEDPVLGGLSPDFLVAGLGGALDRPDVIYFRRGRSSIDESQSHKILVIAAANPGTPLHLVGFASEEESAALAAARTHTVETLLRPPGSLIHDAETVGLTAAGARPSIGSLAYAETRSVRISSTAPGPEIDCHTVASTSEACTPNHAALEARFTAAHTRALAIVDQARTRMAPGADPAREAAIRRRFGVASHPHLRTRLDMLRVTIAAVAGSHACGTTCDASCNSGAVAYSSGPGAVPLMVICDGVLSQDLEYGASVIIHESCHATAGMLQANPKAVGHPADWAYRWERMSATITEMSPNPKLSNTSLDNADSYTQFIMDLRKPNLIPAGSRPIDEAPADDFHGVWNSTQRTQVRRGIADCQKWLIWAGSYMSNAYEMARRGVVSATYAHAALRFGGLAAVPSDPDRERLAGIQSTFRVLSGRIRMAMRIEHSPAGDPTSFGAAAPVLLLVGADAFRIASDRRRGELFVRKLVEGSPEIDPALRAAYSELALDIRNQYEIEHS